MNADEVFVEGCQRSSVFIRGYNQAQERGKFYEETINHVDGLVVFVGDRGGEG